MAIVNGVEYTRENLREILDRSEAWLRHASTVTGASPDWTRDLDQDAATIRRIRTRAASTLINVALLGAFSSGKSFLLGGLQGALELITVPSDDGVPQDKFIGLLPCRASIFRLGL